MTLDPVTTSIAISLGTEAIRKTVGKTYEFIANKYKLTGVAEFKSSYIDYCERLLHINTLASPEHSVFLEDMYVPITLQGINTVTITVEDGTTLDVERAVIIKGLAGMGKSTLLRKLLSNNAKTHDRLPIFYELKNYKGESIEEALSKSLQNVGININSEQIVKILSDSNVKLYLDAFDECPTSFRDHLLDEINRIINRYNCHLICTTRPETELDSLTCVEIYNVKDLTQSQIYAIIKKTVANPEKAKSLCDALEKTRFNKGPESILKSPILVVLFCVSYNIGEEIPDTLSQFYTNIFDTVFFKHDNLKGKVKRTRHWNDDRRIYRALFEYLCFISQRTGVSSFSRESLVGFVADSLSYMNEDRSLSDKISDEIISITNLIIVDGFNEYRFVHKSIQEFFASAFVCTLGHEKRKGFYVKCREDSSFLKLFSNTVFFLEEIDYYNFSEYYLVPDVSKIFNLNRKKLDEKFSVDQEFVDKYLDSVIYRVKQEKEFVGGKMKQLFVTEDLLSPIVIDEKALSSAQIKVFLFQNNFTLIENKSVIIDIVKKYGNFIEENIYYARLRDIYKSLNIDLEKAKELLSLAAIVLYNKKYNNAIDALDNRATQINSQGYLDF